MKTERSESLFSQGRLSIPAGTSNPARGFQQVGREAPIFMQRGQGAHLFDADDNTYIDYVLGWGPLILGHAHPDVVAVLRAQVSDGTNFGTPTQAELELASAIKAALPSVEMVRFVNSGTEATMAAITLATTYTKRPRIIKFRGCYHGWYSPLLTGSPYRSADPSTGDVLLAQYNDLDSVADLFQRYPEQIAGAIIEPVAGNMGVVLPAKGFLEGLRKLCDAQGALLIFDEIMTGFRVAYGGAQALYQVTPDITCLGKIIGGGLPVGAYGAKRKIMDSVAPFGLMYQGGTFSGNPLSAAAGIATLRILENHSIYEQLGHTTAVLCESIKCSAADLDIPVWINQVGAMFSVFFQEGPVMDYDDAQVSDTRAFQRFFWGLLERGIYLPPSQFEACHLSIAHSRYDIDCTSQAVYSTLSTLVQ